MTGESEYFMDIPEDKKIDIILFQLNERYESMHKMRDRSMQFTLWILGFGFGLLWLLLHEVSLNIVSKFIISLMIIIFGFTTFHFLKGIKVGFNKTHQIVIDLEKTLRLYDKDYYESDKRVLPLRYSEIQDKPTDHINTLKFNIIAVVFLLLIITWVNPCKVKQNNNPIIDPNQIQNTKN